MGIVWNAAGQCYLKDANGPLEPASSGSAILGGAITAGKFA